ncbi:MAG: Ig-like domain-containing protein [Anaerolineaceae bacterium]|nr:Ig-like domain-containing protein [Anaerolineaceae bacterium]
MTIKKIIKTHYQNGIVYFIGFITITLFLSGCLRGDNTDSSNTTTKTAEVEANTTLQFTPVPTKALPPVLPEVSDTIPHNQSIIGLNQVFLIYFNQPMDHDSTQSAFEMSPDVSGDFLWFDDMTLQYIPDEPLALSSHYTINITENAQSLAGENFSQSVSFNFQTLGPLDSSSFYPVQSDTPIDPNTAVWVSFNQPIIEEDAKNYPEGFTIEPIISGAGRWANPSTYIFYPATSLIESTKYTVTINQDLQSIFGTYFVEPQNGFSFITRAPEIFSLKPDESQNPLPINQTFTLSFSQPMNTDSVETNIFLVNHQNRNVDLSFEWEENLIASITPLELLEFDSSYTLTIGQDAKTKGGISLGEEKSISFITEPKFDISILPDAVLQVSHNGYAELAFFFTKPLNSDQDFVSFIDIRPYTPANLEAALSPDGKTLTFSGFFRPATYFSYSLSPDLADVAGHNLEEAVYKRFVTTTAPPVLIAKSLLENFPIVYIPIQDVTMPAETTNVRRIDFESATLTNELFILLTKADQITRLAHEADYWNSWYKIVSPYILNAALPVELSLKPFSQKLGTGLYLYKMSSMDLPDEQLPTAFLAVVARTHLMVKRSDSQLLIWAVDSKTLETVDNAPIVIYDQNGNILESGTTDARGILMLELPLDSDTTEIVFAVMNEPGDDLFGFAPSNWDQNFSSADFEQVQESAPENSSAFIFTNKPVYQPDEKLTFKLFVNQEKTAYPELLKTELVYHYHDIITPVQEIFLTLSENGTASGSFTIPLELQQGEFSIRIQELNIDQSLRIALVNPTNLLLETSFEQEHWKIDDTIVGEVSLAFDFDAPIVGMSVPWSLYAQPVPNPANSARELNTREIDCIYSDEILLIGSGDCLTNDEGKCILDFSSEKNLDTLSRNQNYKLILEANYSSASMDMPVLSSGYAQLHPDDFFVDIKTENWGTSAGEELGFQISSFNWQNQSVPDIKLLAKFQKLSWHDEIVFENGEETIINVTDLNQVGSTDFFTDQNGFARLLFVPDAPGVYRLLVESESAAFEQWVWVGGQADSVHWLASDSDKITLVSNQLNYQPGDSAKVFIPNPFDGQAIALATIEADGITREQILTIEENHTILDIPLSEDDVPGIYLSLTMMGQSVDSLPVFRQAYLQIPVTPQDNELLISVQSMPIEKTGNLRLDITTQISYGEAVPAELSLAMIPKASVDQHTLEQWLSNFEAFKNITPLLQIDTSIPLTEYTRQNVYTDPNLTPASFPVSTPEKHSTQKKHLPSAIWVETFFSDESGKVSLEIPLSSPQDWLFYIVGTSLNENLYGSILQSIEEVFPVEISFETPASANYGEQIDLVAIIQNHSQNPVNGTLELSGEGFTSLDEQLILEIELQAGEIKNIKLPIQITGLEQTDIEFTFAPSKNDFPISISKTIDINNIQRHQPVITGLLETPSAQWIQLSPPANYAPLASSSQINLYTSPIILVTELQEALLSEYSNDITLTLASKLLGFSFLQQSATSQGWNQDQIFSQYQSIETLILPELFKSQNPDGGWGISQNHASDPYITANVVFGLLTARDAGFAIHPDSLKQATQYLLQNPLVLSNEKHASEIIQASFIDFIFTSLELPPINTAWLVNNIDVLPLSAKTYLALGLHNTEEKPEVLQTILKSFRDNALTSESGTFWGALNDIRSETVCHNTALVTFALSTIAPENPLAEKGMDYLLTHRNHLNSSQIPDWGSAWLDAWAILSIANHLQTSPVSPPSFDYSLFFGQESLSRGNVIGINEAIIIDNVTIDSTQPALLQIIHEDGDGKLYYDVIRQYTVDPVGLTSENDSFSIFRSYRSASNDCRPGNCSVNNQFDITTDTPIQARLTITLSQSEENIFITDVLPTGMQFIPAENYEWLNPVSVENPLEYGIANELFILISDDDTPLRWYAPSLPAGTYELTYYLNPEFTGEFIIPPAIIILSQNPDRSAASNTSSLSINETIDK